VFHPSITMMDTNEEGENTTTTSNTLKPSSDAPAKFVIGASDEDFEEPEAGDLAIATHVVPPDGGWGWVVVAASFMCNVVVDGIIFSCGMLLPELKKAFNASMTEVSWVNSLLGGFYLIVGPFVSALANAFGFRTVCIMGSIIAAAAFGLSYFATSIYFLHFTFGIVGGTGFGFIYVPAVIATGFYFEKRRALATGIAVCGSGIGTFIFAPLNTYLIHTVGWRMACLVYSGISLSCAIFGLAFRPLEPVVVSDDLDPKGTPLLMRYVANFVKTGHQYLKLPHTSVTVDENIIDVENLVDFICYPGKFYNSLKSIYFQFMKIKYWCQLEIGTHCTITI
ncbi:hypothetical protein SK128_018151, partial [Halocaridina rubra]